MKTDEQPARRMAACHLFLRLPDKLLLQRLEFKNGVRVVRVHVRNVVGQPNERK